jgi:hypothetical protein
MERYGGIDDKESADTYCTLLDMKMIEEEKRCKVA